jgi:putative transcriptional regulator
MDSRIAPGFLVAAPQLTDPHFARTVVFMIEHVDDEGSLGLVINRPAEIDLATVLVSTKLEDGAELSLGDHPPVCYGGPVSPELGWILHTPDWQGDDTKVIEEAIGVTASLDVLEAITRGEGPASYLFCLGYAGWGPHQLVGEIKSGAWINVPFDAGLVFDVPLEERWAAALAKLGIDPSALAPTVGDA